MAALDPGKYGPIAITGPVTVNGNGWAAITGPAQGNGILINAGSGNVILNGLEIDGAGAAYIGIWFNSGGSLTVTNCSLQNFVNTNNNGPSGIGIYIAPTSGMYDFAVTNTTVSNSLAYGIGALVSTPVDETKERVSVPFCACAGMLATMAATESSAKPNTCDFMTIPSKL